MSLRKLPIQTPAFLSSQRQNSHKSTGPRTVAGKARCSLNAFRHGKFTHGLLEKLVVSGQPGRAALYLSIRRAYEDTFGIGSPKDMKQAERFANTAYALGRQAELYRTNPECSLFSARLGPRVMPLFRFRVTAPEWRLGLAFWVQRKKYCGGERWAGATFSSGVANAEPALGRALETRLRHKRYRMYRPRLWERTAYGLDDRGRPDPARKPQRTLQRRLSQFAWGGIKTEG